MSRKINALSASALLALFAALPGCGGGSSSSTVPTGNASFTISVTPTSTAVTIGGERSFTAQALNANGNVITGINFSWHSSDTTIAVSKGGGVFQGIAAGTVDITASASTTSNSGTTFTNVISNVATLTVTSDAVGTAAEGAPIQDGVVSVVDAHGQLTAGSSDAAGRFDIPLDGLTAPFLLKVEDAEGHTLYGVAPGAGIANIDPYTDLLVRSWYALHGSDPSAAFATQAKLPAAADVRALDSFMAEMLADVLEGQGLKAEGFSFVSTPFAADHRGFDRMLDLSQVDPVRGRVVISTPAGLESGTLGLDPASATLHWTQSSALPGGSVSADHSLTLPGRD